MVNGGIDEVDESLFPVRRRNICHIAVLSTYVPRECGIAVYTERLVEGLNSACATRRKELNRRLNMRDPVSSSYDQATSIVHHSNGTQLKTGTEPAALSSAVRIEVIPVRHKDMPLSEYDSETVKIGIREWEPSDYVAAADYVNREGFGLVLLQYEFG